MEIEEIDQLVNQFDAVKTEDIKVCELATRISLMLGLLAGRLEELGCDRLVADLDSLQPKEEDEVVNLFAHHLGGEVRHIRSAGRASRRSRAEVSLPRFVDHGADLKTLPGLGEK